MALDFAGNAYLAHTNASAIPSSSISFSMCGWFQTDAATANDWNALFGMDNQGSNYSIFETGYTNTLAFLYFNSGSYDLKEFTPAIGSTWQFIAMVVAGDSTDEQTHYWRTEAASALTEGVPGTVNATGFTPSQVMIGDSGVYPGEFWDGRVAHVRVWDGALTEAQLLTESKYDTLQYTTGALADYSLDVQGDYANDYNPGVGTLVLSGTAPTTATGPSLLSSGGVPISTIQHFRHFIGGM